MPHQNPAGVDRPAGGDSLRVLYLIDSLGHGGAEHLLTAYLPSLAGLGITPEVCALQVRDGNPVAATIQSLGVPVRTLEVTRLRRPDAYRQVAAAVDAAKPDVVHTQLEFATILGGLAARRRGIPTVSTLHTMGRPAPRTLASLRFQIEAWALRRRTDRVVAVSENARQEYLDLLNLAPEQVVTIHNGIDIARFDMPAHTRSEVRSELSIPESAALAVTVAVLRPPKGIDNMLGALPAISSAVPDLHYLVVGDGPARHGLERMAAELGAADRVTFAGKRSDIPRLLAAADVFVLPTHTEALPTAVAEAMAAGLPVVASRVGGIPEMIDEYSGVLVPPGDSSQLSDAVLRVLTDPDAAARMGKAGARTAAERFELGRQAEKLVAEYRALVRSKVMQ